MTNGWQSKLKTWYAPDKFLSAIAALGADLYEREILRLVFQKYIKEYRKNNKYPNAYVHLSHKDFSSVMKEKRFRIALTSLNERTILTVEARRGRAGGYTVSIMTHATVSQLVNKSWTAEAILSTDSILLI